MHRRAFLSSVGAAALGARFAFGTRDASAQIAVPNSAGTQLPKLNAPPNACDCHMHTYDPARFAMVPNPRVPPSNAAVPQYRVLQQRIGTTRIVIVTPRNYATQNDVTLDAIGQLGRNARGIAVVHPSVTGAELTHLNDGGIRGIRFTLTDPAAAVTTIDMVEPLSPDATLIAKAFVKAAPERLVWGSDWPHPTAKETPDDAALFDLLGTWAPDERTRHRILVENPETLYGFSRAGGHI